MPVDRCRRRNDRSLISTRRRPLMAPQLQSRIYTSLTDVTRSLAENSRNSLSNRALGSERK